MLHNIITLTHICVDKNFHTLKISFLSKKNDCFYLTDFFWRTVNRCQTEVRLYLYLYFISIMFRSGGTPYFLVGGDFVKYLFETTRICQDSQQKKHKNTKKKIRCWTLETRMHIFTLKFWVSNRVASCSRTIYAYFTRYVLKLI